MSAMVSGGMCFEMAPQLVGLKGGHWTDLPSTALLDLCDVELEKAVKPLDQLLPIERKPSV